MVGWGYDDSKSFTDQVGLVGIPRVSTCGLETVELNLMVCLRGPLHLEGSRVASRRLREYMVEEQEDVA